VLTLIEKHAHTAAKSKATREANKAKKQNRKLSLQKNQHHIQAVIQMNTQMGVLGNIRMKVKFKGTLTNGNELNSAEQENKLYLFHSGPPIVMQDGCALRMVDSLLPSVLNQWFFCKCSSSTENTISVESINSILKLTFSLIP
jgi:hypothetical protein